MTQATTVLPGAGANGAGLLSKERTYARPGFNRWLVPPAALAIHLCIGMAYGFSVFWLPLSRAVGITSPVACPADMTFLASLFATGCDWKISTLGWMYTLFFVFLGGAAAIWGGWLEHAGPRKAGVVAAVCWCGGLVLLGGRRLPASDLDAVAGLRGHRRHRARARLHLAGLDADQVVPRPARHGDRNGDHGLRRRRDDRRAARRSSDEALRDTDLGRRLANVPHARRDLFRVHDVRGVRLPRAAAGVEAGRLDAACPERREDDHDAPRAPERRVEDAAVLAALGGAVPERHRRHRRHRHGLADAAGGVRRPTDRRRCQVRRPERRPAQADRRHRGGLHRSARACSTSPAASSGRRCPTTSAAR